MLASPLQNRYVNAFYVLYLPQDGYYRYRWLILTGPTYSLVWCPWAELISLVSTFRLCEYRFRHVHRHWTSVVTQSQYAPSHSTTVSSPPGFWRRGSRPNVRYWTLLPLPSSSSNRDDNSEARAWTSSVSTTRTGPSTDSESEVTSIDFYPGVIRTNTREYGDEHDISRVDTSMADSDEALQD